MRASWALLLGWIPILAGATSFIEQPFPETIRDAPVIVRGKVGSSSPEWGIGVDGSRRIYTYYGLQVEEVLKGKAPVAGIQMRELGGEKDGVGMHVAGTAQFNRGEDVVVFLSDRNADGSFDVRGLMMGKYTLQKDESGAEVLSGPGLGGGGHGSVPGHAGEGQGDPNSRPRWTLEGLRQVIREQGDGPREEPNRVIPQASPSPAVPQPGSASTAQQRSTQAPQLQPDPSGSPQQGGESSGRFIWIFAIGGLVLLGALGVRFRKRG